MIIIGLLITLYFAHLNAMDKSESDEQLLQRHKELKEEREARKQSDQSFQQKQDSCRYSWPTYTEEEYQKRLAELEVRFAQVERERAKAKAITKEELRAKLKREEEELNARRKQEEERVQALLNESVADISK